MADIRQSSPELVNNDADKIYDFAKGNSIDELNKDQ